MSQEPSAQRRASARATRHLTVRYRRATEPGAWHVAALRDISQDGARLTSELAFRPQELLVMELGLPVFSQDIHLSARVVWDRAVALGGLTWHECGLVFTALPDEAKKALAGAVHRFLSRPPSPRR